MLNLDIMKRTSESARSFSTMGTQHHGRVKVSARLVRDLREAGLVTALNGTWFPKRDCAKKVEAHLQENACISVTRGSFALRFMHVEECKKVEAPPLPSAAIALAA
jgi:hypothetical protein